MYILPLHRDNNSWDKINTQYFKGGFNWYNQKNPHHNNWYYHYYINIIEKKSCKNISKRKKYNKVSNWLRNIEKFEEIHNKLNIIE